jgi:hypothetical protein
LTINRVQATVILDAVGPSTNPWDCSLREGKKTSWTLTGDFGFGYGTDLSIVHTACDPGSEFHAGTIMTAIQGSVNCVGDDGNPIGSINYDLQLQP